MNWTVFSIIIIITIIASVLEYRRSIDHKILSVTILLIGVIISVLSGQIFNNDSLPQKSEETFQTQEDEVLSTSDDIKNKEKNTDSSASNEEKIFNIEHPAAIVYYGELSEENYKKTYTITAENSGEYGIVLSEIYADAYFEIEVTDKYGECIVNQHSFGWYGYILEAGNDYNITIRYINGTPSYKLSIYPANEVIDISGTGTINDYIAAPWMDNYYTYIPDTSGEYEISIKSSEYFELNFYDEYGYEINGNQTAINSEKIILDCDTEYKIIVTGSVEPADYSFTINFIG